MNDEWIAWVLWTMESNEDVDDDDDDEPLLRPGSPSIYREETRERFDSGNHKRKSKEERVFFFFG